MSEAIDPHLINLVVGIFGAMMVGIYSWSRFDEPTYTESEHFARYKPRFATSRALYIKAKLAYTAIAIVVYVIFSAVPGALTIFGVNSVPTGPSVPLFVALLITTLQACPGIKEVEHKFRGFLHAQARIPEGVRRAVSQMQVSPFPIAPAVMQAQTLKFKSLCGSAFKPSVSFSDLMTEDETLHIWCKMGALLTVLSETNRSQSGIDLLFFDYYKDEFDSINAMHGILAENVAERICSRIDRAADDSVLNNARDLRDRLYTFVACGVLSSISNAAEEADLLRSLGFNISPASAKIPIIPLIGMSVIAILALSIITAILVQVFRSTVLSRVDHTWQAVFPIPRLPFETYTWSWSSAAFYLATIFTALLVRNTRVAQRQWFDMSNLERERPVFLYATPILFGTLAGWLMLSTIAFVGGPGFSPSLPVSLGEVSRQYGQAMYVSALWLPVAVVMAGMVVILSDAPLGSRGSWRRKIPIIALAGGFSMAVVGFANTELVVSNLVTEHSRVAELQEVPQKVKQVEYLVDTFIALNIGVISFVLFYIFLMFEANRTKALLLEGKTLTIINRQGPLFNVALGPNRKASLTSAQGNDGARQKPFEGRWQQFPEGISVEWLATNGHFVGRLGVISRLQGLLIYEGYEDRLSGKPKFFAQAQLSQQ